MAMTHTHLLMVTAVIMEEAIAGDIATTIREEANQARRNSNNPTIRQQ